LALNTRPVLHPKWTSHNVPVEDGLGLAHIQIIKPNAVEKTYDAVSNTWTESTATIYEGWARIQPLRQSTISESSNDFIPMTGKDVAMFFNLKKNLMEDWDGELADIRPGYEVIVISAVADPLLTGFQYTVKSVINSSNSWSRGITCEVNQESRPVRG
jgi:hypothetical protein